MLWAVDDVFEKKRMKVEYVAQSSNSGLITKAMDIDPRDGFRTQRSAEFADIFRINFADGPLGRIVNQMDLRSW